MSYSVKVLSAQDRKLYSDFVANPAYKPHVTFMHTYEWGECMQRQSATFERVGVYRGSDLVAVGQLSQKPLRLGGYYWYCPRGLVLDYTNTDVVAGAYKALQEHTKRSGAAFLRVDPDVVRGDAAEDALDSLGPKQAAIFTQAERVWCADIQKTPEEQLTWMRAHGMAKKMPYYYRKALREGVTVRASNDPADLEKLIASLNDLNMRKGGIGKHTDDYYRAQFAIMAPAGYEKVFLAEKDGQLLAAALIAMYGREASYLHAASTELHRDLWAPRALLLEVMMYCQRERPEIERFNFWGIVGDKNRNASHPRHGYSEFKRSFGGYKEQYIRARDFVYNPLQWQLSWALDKYRTWKYKND